jgi:hypothetical protein
MMADENLEDRVGQLEKSLEILNILQKGIGGYFHNVDALHFLDTIRGLGDDLQLLYDHLGLTIDRDPRVTKIHETIKGD